MYQATVAGGVAGEPVLLTRVLGLTYSDATVEWNTTYRYTVGAMTEFGEGPACEVGPVTPVEEVAPPPVGPVVPTETVEHTVAGPSMLWVAVAAAVAAGVAGVGLVRMRRRT